MAVIRSNRLVWMRITPWGNVLIDPTARYIQDKNDYESDREPVEDFAEGTKVLLPGIEPSDFVPAYSGIRPKLIPPLSPSMQAHGKGMADFIFCSRHRRARNRAGRPHLCLTYL